ncbi:MAG: hydroxymethylbilane synthase [Nocardioides sp.]
MTDQPQVTGQLKVTGQRWASVRLGTRASLLARSQAQTVAAAMGERWGAEVSLVEIISDGDRLTGSLAALGGAGVFVGALRQALLAGQVDVIVHSLKDLPTAHHPQIALAAVPLREDPRDVLVARDSLTAGELPPGSRIGTGAPRRAAQLRALALGLSIEDIRGNVDTRLAKVQAGEYDAVVLARAGLARLGRLAEITEVLDPLQMLPAPGQGALAIECRAGDEALLAGLADLEDPASRAAVEAERALLAGLEAGCSAPVGALAEVVQGDHGDELWLRAIAISPDGVLSVKMSITGSPDDAIGVGTRLASQMLADGAVSVMASPAVAEVAAVTPLRRQGA